MRLNKRIGKIVVICSTCFLLATPVIAGYGPGDGTGNDGDGPKDGTGNGPGDCTTAVFHVDDHQLLARGGNGNGGGKGGHGPGDGTGNGGDGPRDGTGNGPGDCVSS